MANTLGTLTKLDDNAFTGTFKTLHYTGPLSIVPVDKTSENAPDHRVFAELATKSAPVGARSRNQAARPTSTSSSQHLNSDPSQSTAGSSNSNNRPKTAPPT